VYEIEVTLELNQAKQLIVVICLELGVFSIASGRKYQSLGGQMDARESDFPVTYPVSKNIYTKVIPLIHRYAKDTALHQERKDLCDLIDYLDN
jgi:hypothetical protein